MTQANGNMANSSRLCGFTIILSGAPTPDGRIESWNQKFDGAVPVRRPIISITIVLNVLHVYFLIDLMRLLRVKCDVGSEVDCPADEDAAWEKEKQLVRKRN